MTYRSSILAILISILLSLPLITYSAESKLYGGGGVGLTLGSTIAVRINPFVGYHILPKTSAGVGIVYEYNSYKSYATSIYGGSVFAEQYFTDNIFVHGEYELLSLETAMFDHLGLHSGQKRFLHHGILVGAGYRQQVSDNGSFFIMALVNLNQTDNSPYMMPIIKVGFSFN